MAGVYAPWRVWDLRAGFMQISRGGQISQFRICSDPVRLFWYQDFILKITSAVVGNLKKIGNLKYQSQIKGAQDRIFQTIWFFFGPGTTFDRSGLDFQILGLFQRQVQNREWKKTENTQQSWFEKPEHGACS